LKLGLSIPQVGVNGTRENALKLAQAAEKENFESLWVQERILWPINPQSKYPQYKKIGVGNSCITINPTKVTFWNNS